MVIDPNKPIEVVANWDETIVYPATLLKVFDNDHCHISIDERHQVFKDGFSHQAGQEWILRKDGTFADLTLRNVQEVDEITWENCPEWAKDEAAKRIGFVSWSRYRAFDGPLFDWKTDAPAQLALMIAKYEEPAEPTDPSIEIAREIVKRYYPEVKPTGDDPLSKIAVDAYRRALKDQKASRDAERSEAMEELLAGDSELLFEEGE